MNLSLELFNTVLCLKEEPPALYSQPCRVDQPTTLAPSNTHHGSDVDNVAPDNESFRDEEVFPNASLVWMQENKGNRFVFIIVTVFFLFSTNNS